MTAAEPSDADLVARSVAGQREAFGQIVQRYQSLVCSMAYSSTGSIAQSEDVGQDVFLSAWKQLRQLREPASLKSWLCGITRHALHNDFRRSNREPIHGAASLEGLLETAAHEPLPSERAISREEEGILWRSLAGLPATYRVPLILFYREHQSVARVAAALDLSEEAVKQRLSRGRKLLQEQVLAFVQGALAQTSPGHAFTFGVLSALPPLSIAAGSAAIGTAAAKGSAVGKAAASAGFLLSVAGPWVGLFGAAAGTKLAMESTTSPRERKFVRQAWTAMWAGAILYVVATYLGIRCGKAYWKAHPAWLVWGLVGSVFCYGMAQGFFARWVGRVQSRIQGDDMKEPAHPLFGWQRYEYRSRWTLCGLPLLHVRFGQDEKGLTLPAKGWIAVGRSAYGILFAAGATAVGLVSVGATAIGVFAVGGLGVGLLAFGGVSLGVGAAGGCAIGYVALGGGAVGWLGASGGAAVAHYFAQGGAALAEHANDPAARDFMRHSAFFHYAELLIYPMILLSWLSLAVPAYVIRRLKRRRLSPSNVGPILPGP
jgi:RNA polymerase sigma factor (sigma-70 family)